MAECFGQQEAVVAAVVVAVAAVVVAVAVVRFDAPRVVSCSSLDGVTFWCAFCGNGWAAVVVVVVM